MQRSAHADPTRSWIDSISSGNLIEIKKIHCNDIELRQADGSSLDPKEDFVFSFLSKEEHRLLHIVPDEKMNSAHLAAHFGQPKVMACILDQSSQIGETYTEQFILARSKSDKNVLDYGMDALRCAADNRKAICLEILLSLPYPCASIRIDKILTEIKAGSKEISILPDLILRLQGNNQTFITASCIISFIAMCRYADIACFIMALPTKLEEILSIVRPQWKKIGTHLVAQLALLSCSAEHSFTFATLSKRFEMTGCCLAIEDENGGAAWDLEPQHKSDVLLFQMPYFPSSVQARFYAQCLASAICENKLDVIKKLITVNLKPTVSAQKTEADNEEETPIEVSDLISPLWNALSNTMGHGERGNLACDLIQYGADTMPEELPDANEILLQALEHRCAPVLFWLLQHASKHEWTLQWEHISSQGDNALHVAVYQDNCELAKALNGSIDLTTKNALGKTPIILALESSRRKMLLILMGIDSEQTQSAQLLPLEYLLWNTALCRELRYRVNDGKGPSLLLPYSPGALKQIIAPYLPDLDEESSEDSLTDCVSHAYRYGKMDLFENNDGGLPLCVAFLVVSVIAASKMDNLRDYTAAAYYPRLREQLGFVRGDSPPGLSTPQSREQFCKLWMSLHRWLTPRGLVLPESGSIDFPIIHALLRARDICKLPEYFVKQGFVNGSSIRPERLRNSFSLWANQLTSRGREVLKERQEEVLKQVSEELARWNGTVFEALPGIGSRGRTTVDVEWRIRKKRLGGWNFMLRVKHPVSFPNRIPLKAPFLSELEYEGENYYNPILIRDDQKSALSKCIAVGWENCFGDAEQPLVLRWKKREIVVFAPTAEAGFDSAPCLKMNVPCILLCDDKHAGSIEEYLTSVCMNRAIRRTGPLPGWTLFEHIYVTRSDLAVPQTLKQVEEALMPQTDLDVRFQGGLRLMSGDRWHADMPPTLLLSGKYQHVSLNGEKIQIGLEGKVDLKSFVGIAGAILLQIDSQEERIELVEPQRRLNDIVSPTPVLWKALPKGEWLLFGPRIGQSERLKLSRDEAVRLTFEPTWIVSVTKQRIHAGVSFPNAPLPPEHADLKTLNAYFDAVREVSLARQIRGGFSDLSNAQANRCWINFKNEVEALKQFLIEPSNPPAVPIRQPSQSPSLTKQTGKTSKKKGGKR